MNKKDFLKFLLEKYKTSGAIEILKRNYKELYEEIDKNWLYEEKVKFSEKIYYYLYEKNPYCNHGKKKRFVSMEKGYFSENVANCEQCMKKIVEKREKTCLKKYGTRSSLQSKEVKDKAKKTLLKNYGIEHPFHSEKILEKVKKTLVKKYGVDHPLRNNEIKNKVKEKWKSKDKQTISKIEDKKRKTWMKKYGVDHPFSSKEIREKIKKTCIEKYGESHHLRNPDIKANFKKVFLQKHGVENPFLSPVVKRKVEIEMIKRYGVNHPSKSKVVQKRKQNTFMKKYGVEHNSQINIKNFEDWKNNFIDIYEKFGGNENILSEYFNVDITAVRRKAVEIGLRNKYFSSFEKELQIFLENEKIEFSTRNRKILDNKYEIDIFISSCMLALECNGNFWHSCFSGNKGRNYHRNKSLYCMKKGIYLLHIWEYLWEEKKDAYKELILSYARKNDKKTNLDKMIIKEIEKEKANELFSRYDLSNLFDNDVNIAALDKNEIISVIGLEKERKSVWVIRNTFFHHNTDKEILLETMIKNFHMNFSFDKIKFFCDISWFFPNILENSGFKLYKKHLPTFLVTENYKNFTKYEEKYSMQNKKSMKTIMEDLRREKLDIIWNCGIWEYHYDVKK